MSPVETLQKPPKSGRLAPPGLRLLDQIDPSCAPGLPIARAWNELTTAVREHQVVIVTGETGSGKTTQLPKICLKAGRGRRGRIVCTQPRRVAAVTVASRLAEELGDAGPRLVGYRVRFRDRTGPETRIQFVTDGLLLAEVQRDPFLKRYDTIIIDEAHERSLNIDFLLGLVRRLLPRRSDLKVIITSATMDTERFSEVFGEAPVIEVRGRWYPVEVRYRPAEGAEETTPADQVISAVAALRHEDPLGDILVFLPTERDIQEATLGLKGICPDEGAVVLPMYGRLSMADQHRIFQPAAVQKIVVATNVAETSITVPGIRYVVDSGLARIARYNIRSRTKALPVSPISRASADQRAGRAGRMEAGICVRLYSEEDYLSRPQYTVPEILRSNLAEVILRLTALNLGPVTDFPFVDPPSPRAIREGFTTLRELGALDPEGRLTRTGRLMARLPLDPRISRMILEARKENALREVSVIAAALSIQDPRQRPAEDKARADQAQARFQDQESDFLGFLRLWEAYQRELEAGSGLGRARRFCREHFLSFNRMREWRDVYEQILAVLAEAGDFLMNDTHADYGRIHRSVLAGFLGHIAMHQEGGRYLAARGGEVRLFPGSGLYKRRPRWLVAAELVKTSRLFARTAAGIEPKWLEKIAPDQCRRAYSEPHWEKRRGEVVAFERVTLFGLPIVEGRKVGFGRVNPEEARAIFIRDGLVPGELKGAHPFLEHNRAVMSEAQGIEDRTRRRDLVVDEEALCLFYDLGLRGLEHTTPGKGTSAGGLILDERTLARALAIRGDDACLRLARDDCLRALPGESELSLFPGGMEVAGHVLPLTYRFAPGDASDGVTVGIRSDILLQLPERPFEWLVPGLLPEKVAFLLRGLPKQVRRGLVPIPLTAEGLCAGLGPCDHPLLDALEGALKDRFRLAVERSMWSIDDIPTHLRMRFHVVDGRKRVLMAGRDLAALKEEYRLAAEGMRDTDPRWVRARAEWERSDLSLKVPFDLPQWVPLDRKAPKGPLRAFPGLALDGDKVALRLFADRQEAAASTRQAAPRLIAEHLGVEVRQLERLSIPERVPLAALAPLGGAERIGKATFSLILRELLGPFHEVPTRAQLISRADELKGTLIARAQPILRAVREALETRLAVHGEIERLRALNGGHAGPAALFDDLKRDLSRLVPMGFPAGATLGEMGHLGRYLKAVSLRAERAYAAPARDAAKAASLAPFVERLMEASKALGPDGPQEAASALNRFRFLLEEYRVSLFAQELGTAVPVSPKRLEEAWRQLKGLLPDSGRCRPSHT